MEKNRDICEFANQNRKPMSQGGRTKIAELLQSTPAGSEVTAKGWVRTKRGNKNVAFIALNDGSITNNKTVSQIIDRKSTRLNSSHPK